MQSLLTTSTLFAAAAVFSIPPSCHGGPVTKVGRQVPAAERVAVERISHDVWDGLLTKYVDDNGLVDYRRWKASADDRRLLAGYLRHLSSAAIDQKSPRRSQLAFWINAYNAVTIEGILREYPTDSIRDHTAKFFGYNIWKDLQLTVGGRPYSLEAIEHKVLRKLGEPRIHFAIVCASIGCPRLLNEAYVAERLDAQLTANARHFFADSDKFQANAQSRTVSVSPILKWFAEDFGPNKAAQMRTIAPYVPAPAQAVVRSDNVRVRYLDYDWGLNDQTQRRNP